MNSTTKHDEPISVGETVLAAILHYNDRCQLLEERVAETLQQIALKKAWSVDDVRGCTHEIDALQAERSDLVIYARKWEYYPKLRPVFARHTQELRLLREAFQGIALLAPS